MLIDSIDISAFRGIRENLPLDLTARITLLHAPNGTGKTSVCDATEWLLTGVVSRLATALRNSSTGGVRNLFAEDRATAIEGRLRFGSSVLNVRRTLAGDGDKLEQENPTWRAFAQNKLVERLTPSNLPAGSARQQNLNRAAWLRAVRFIEASDLELLLDDTKGAQDIRGLLFSNLFGMGELQTREQTLEKIRDAMMRPGKLESESARLETEIQEVETALKSAGDRASEPFVATARQHLSAVGLYLGVALEDNVPPSQQVSVLESVRASQEQRLLRERSTLATLAREWDRFQALSAELSALEKEQAADALRLAEMRTQNETLAPKVRESTAAVNQCALQEQRLRGLDLENLEITLSNALTSWRSAGADPDAVLDIASLRAVEQTALKRIELEERQHGAFATCTVEIPRWLELVGQIRATEERTAALEIPTADSVAANERVLSEAQDQLGKIEATSAQLAGPLDQLRTEGRRLLGSLPDEHRCPLCAHDHLTPSQLREAIDAGLQVLPAALSVLATQKTTQEAIVSEAKERKRRWAAIVAEVEQINRSNIAARGILSDAAAALRITGAELPEMSSPEFLEQFRTAEAEKERSLASAQRNQAEALAHRVAGDSLIAARDKIAVATNLLRSNFPQVSIEISLDSLPPSGWPTKANQLKGQVTAAMLQAAKEKENATTVAEGHQQEVTKITSKIAELSAAIDSRGARLSDLRSALLPLTEDWRSIADEAPLTKETLDALPQRLAQLEDNLLKSLVDLRLANENLIKADEAKAREREVISNQSQVNRLRADAQRLARIRKRRAELDKAVEMLRTTKEAFINQQIQPLCSVITALYLRAQSNAFITAIGTDESGGAHRWTANADDHRMEAIAQLSQGQRQDFALAVFLARARDVRGTFFLDEPLLHLDDLNRIALLDVLRVLILEPSPDPLRLVITTASNALVRHFREKFSLLPPDERGPALRIYRLSGDPRAGVTAGRE